jgi:hypothetical protein
LSKAGKSVGPVNCAAWLFAIETCFLLIGLIFASSITVGSTIYQTEFGFAMSVTSGLIATDVGFSTASSGSGSSGANCTSPVVFGPLPKTANTGITSGHLIYEIQVNTTAITITSHNYNVTLTLGSNKYGPLCIQTLVVQPPNEMIDCRFDIGTALPAAPYAFKVTVQ